MAHITSFKSWKEGRKEKAGLAAGAGMVDERLEARVKATEEALYAWRESAKARVKRKPWWKFW
ncbi:MAG: hypothetical protein ACOY30_06940 [Bacillota bacterium]